VFGYLYCAGEAVKRMARRHGGAGGAIVNISSAAARLGGLPSMVPYAASVPLIILNTRPMVLLWCTLMNA
jgi:NAD(P)-dependent dehydrogenase (short-subunit alcohol dehydrogenase family)